MGHLREKPLLNYEYDLVSFIPVNEHCGQMVDIPALYLGGPRSNLAQRPAIQTEVFCCFS